MAVTTATVPDTQIRGKRLAGILAGLMLSLFLTQLDSTIVGTAMPRIIAELHGFEQYSWVATAYLLASTAMVPIVSKLSDIYGRKRQLIITIVGFVGGSMLCGQAQTMNQLIAFRTIQGIAGGGLAALVFTAVADLFAPAERGKWAGLLASVQVTSTVVGPPIGGLLTEQFTWRWIFYVNLPICFVVLTVLTLGFPNLPGVSSSGATGWRRIDFPGSITLVMAIASLLLGVVEGGSEFNWLTPKALGLLGFAVAAFLLFLWVEKRAVEPIIPLDLFNNQILRMGSIAAFLQGFVFLAGSLYAPLYIQSVIGDSPSRSGLVLIPQIFAGLAANIIVGQLLARLGRYKPLLIAGALLFPLGIALWVLMATLGNRWAFIVSGVVYAVGFSTMAPSLNVAFQNALPIPRLGVGTGTLQVIRSIGQTMGAAVVGAIIVGGYVSVVTTSLPPEAAALPPAVLSQLTDPQHVLVREGGGPTQVQIAGVPQALSDQVLAAVHSAIAIGLRNGFIGMFVAALLCALILAFGIPDAPLRRSRSG